MFVKRFLSLRQYHSSPPKGAVLQRGEAGVQFVQGDAVGEKPSGARGRISEGLGFGGCVVDVRPFGLEEDELAHDATKVSKEAWGGKLFRLAKDVGCGWMVPQVGRFRRRTIFGSSSIGASLADGRAIPSPMKRT